MARIPARSRTSWVSPRVSVVIPALNEADNLEHVLAGLAKLGDAIFEVVLVDGNSTDDTVEVARRARPDVRVVKQSRRGKGNALMCGFYACRGDVIVMMDADGSTDPAEIPSFVSALRGAHFAKGTRFAAGGGSADITRLRSLGNAALNRLANHLYHTCYTDLCYGYNAFWADCLPYLEVLEPGRVVDAPENPSVGLEGPRWGDGFEIETVLAVRVSMLGLHVAEVGSYESRRLHGASNLHAFRDGWKVLRTIAIERKRFAVGRGQLPPLPEPWRRDRIELARATVGAAAE
jgi:glycosyltransferase involved in cell wall biosynthesis